MFRINPRVKNVDDNVMKLYKEIGTSTLGHLTDFGFLKGMKPVLDHTRFIGNAVTVRIPHMDSTAVHKALDVIETGDVLVIDMSGDEYRSCFGGIVSYAARAKGASGVVIGGCVNDVDEIRAIDFPIFSLGVSPLTTRIRGVEGEINTPVSVCGVSIQPGDLIVADNDGVVVIDPELSRMYAEKALQKESNEEKIKEKIDSGMSLASISKASEFV